MHSPVEQIKERLSIEEVVSSYVSLKQTGKNLKARCPFHNERTPSFFISPDRGTYYCFGCGAKGDIFTFVQEFEGLDFSGALKLLADQAGVELKPVSQEHRDQIETLYDIHEQATVFFEKNLTKDKEAQKYLQSRGIDSQTVATFRIGYVPDEWSALYSHLRKQGFSASDMETAGLIVLSKKSANTYYDRFRSRIMFPITDSSGRVIAFSGRQFPETEREDVPKYLNSPETPLFDKGATLFGMFHAKEAIRKYDFAILVEGQVDVLLAHQAGYRNTIALSGTALSTGTKRSTHVHMMQRLSNNLVIAFDSDKAGKQATVRNAKLALSLGMDVKVAELPEGLDPADVIAESGPEAWKTIIKQAVHIIDFQLREVAERTGSERKIGMAVRSEVLPLVAQLKSAIEKSHFIARIRDVTGIPETALQEDLEQVARSVKEEQSSEQQTIPSSRASVTRKDVTREALAGLLYTLQENDQALLEEVIKRIKSIRPKFSLEEFFSPYNGKPPEGALFSLESEHEGITKELAQEVTDAYCIEWIKTYLKQLSGKIKQLESRDDASATDLLQQYHEYSKILQTIQDR